MGSAVLDTGIGLVFVFLAVSLICSGVTESIANLLNKRASFLIRGLRELLDGSRNRRLEWQTILGPLKDKPAPLVSTRDVRAIRDETGKIQKTGGGLTAQLLCSPMITALRRPSWARRARGHHPSYIAASTFSRVLLDVIDPADGSGANTSVDRLVTRLPDSVGGHALRVFAREAQGDLDRYRAAIEQWYDEQMRRVSGWYKRWAKKMLIVVGLAVAIGANVDTLSVVSSLYHDAPLRSAVVAQAVSAQACTGGAANSPQNCLAEQRSLLERLSLPIGWNDTTTPDDLPGWAWKALGWLLTAAAAGLGGPFWFDALGKLGNWRNTGPKPASGAG